MIQEEDAELGKQNGTEVKISDSPKPEPKSEPEYKVTEGTSVKTETETCAVLTGF